jgi:hypothetical protein
MPSQDEIMKQILELVSEGAGMTLAPEVESTLHERYYAWIVTTKAGNSNSPQQIWDGKEGGGIQQKFREIGGHLSQKNLAPIDLDGAACKDSCRTIERLSECPHCPDPSF